MDGLKAASRPKVTSPSAQARHECPGGSHAPLERALAQVLDELGVASRAVGVAPVGCALLYFEKLDVDFVTAPPGRATAVAAGIKRAQPHAVVFAALGGWDASSIGAGEILQAAARREPIAVLYTNLAEGSCAAAGLPIAELVAAVEGAARVERVVYGGEPDLPALREALSRALSLQLGGEAGAFAFVEIAASDNAGDKRRAGCLKEPAQG